MSKSEYKSQVIERLFVICYSPLLVAKIMLSME